MQLGAVLQAAGSASRMGYRPKCLLEINGQALIVRIAQALLDAGVDDLVVVTGHYSKEVRSALDDFPVTFIDNPQPSLGQVSSQRLGLLHLMPNHDAIIMALADQPLIETQDISELIHFYEQCSKTTSVVYPRVNDQPGNPVLISGKAREDILACSNDMGVRDWRRLHEEEVMALDCDNLHYVTDLDTPDDLSAFTKRTGIELKWPTPHL
jgi:molybdenum cofactor cytidylyltransferase